MDEQDVQKIVILNTKSSCWKSN